MSEGLSAEFTEWLRFRETQSFETERTPRQTSPSLSSGKRAEALLPGLATDELKKAASMDSPAGDRSTSTKGQSLPWKTQGQQESVASSFCTGSLIDFGETTPEPATEASTDGLPYGMIKDNVFKEESANGDGVSGACQGNKGGNNKNPVLDERLSALRSHLMKVDLLLSATSGPPQSGSDDPETRAPGETPPDRIPEEGIGANTRLEQTAGIPKPSAESSLPGALSRSDTKPEKKASGSSTTTTETAGFGSKLPPPVPPRRKHRLAARVFNMNGVLDVKVHLANIRAIGVEAIVNVDRTVLDTTTSSVSITGVDPSVTDQLPYRYVITVAPQSVLPGADPGLNLSIIASAYDLVWRQATESGISSIALTPILGRTNGEEFAASAICLSLLRLCTNYGECSIQEVHVVDKTGDVLSVVIHNFEEAMNRRAKLTITELEYADHRYLAPLRGQRSPEEQTTLPRRTGTEDPVYYSYDDGRRDEPMIPTYGNVAEVSAPEPVRLASDPDDLSSDATYANEPVVRSECRPGVVQSCSADPEPAAANTDTYDAIEFEGCALYEEVVDSGSQPRPAVFNKPADAVSLPAGFLVAGRRKLIVHVGDITRLKVDAIVCPVSSLLQPASSLARDVHQGAGHRLAENLTTIVVEGGPVRETDVVETLAGSLPCRYVLHAVAPRHSENDPDAADNFLVRLQRTFENVLDYADAIGVRTIALPVLGSGAKRVPAAMVTKTLCKAMIPEMKRTPPGGDPAPKEVHVVGKSGELLSLFVAHCLNVHSRGGAVTPIRDPDVWKAIQLVSVDDHQSPAGSGSERRQATEGVPFEQRTFKVGRDTAVVIHVGNIVELRLDAIVSADDQYLGHGVGVARTICEAAGPEMTSYLWEIAAERAPLRVSDVVQTPPGRLPCHVVLHAVGPSWPTVDVDASQTVFCLMQLKRTLDNVFDAARQNDTTSIAIPPIGTDIPVVHVAEKMYRAVVDNVRHQQSVGGCLREVHFVDSKPDVLTSLVLLFEEGQRDARMTNVSITRADVETATRLDRALGRDERGQIRNRPSAVDSGASSATGRPLIGDGRASVPRPVAQPAAAVTWEKPIAFLVHNAELQVSVRVAVYLANIATLSTDAIVNPTDRRMNHDAGISRIIARTAGAAWKAEGRKLIGAAKVPVGGVISTGPGNLPCRTVLNVVCPKFGCANPNDGYQIRNYLALANTCLENLFLKVAELGSVRTIALPPVRSVKDPAPRQYVTTSIVAVLTRNANMSWLTEIHIVDDDKDFLSDVVNILYQASLTKCCTHQVSQLNSGVEEMIGRVVTPPSGSTAEDDDHLYAEIQADNKPRQDAKLAAKKLARGPSRLPKLKIHKKQAAYEDTRPSSSFSSSSEPAPSPDLPPRHASSLGHR